MNKFILVAILSINNHFNFNDDKSLVQDLSNQNIMVVMNHQKRIMGVLTKQPEEARKIICETLQHHPKVNLDKIINMIQKTSYQCIENFI